MPIPRMLVLDLDGTTLTDDRQITPRDREAALALAERGVHVTVATGRLFPGARWAARTLGVRGTVAAMNGSELIDVDTEQVVHGRYFDADTRALVRGTLSASDLGAVLFRSRWLHFDRRYLDHAHYLSTWTDDLTAHETLVDGPVWESGAEDLLAVGMIGTSHAVDPVLQVLADALTGDYEVLQFRALNGGTFVKLRHRAEDKGTALVRMAAARGLTAADTVAVGDWLNDVPMLRTAGLSFAMGGSTEAVTEAADEVLDARAGAGGAIAEIARRVWDVDLG